MPIIKSAIKKLRQAEKKAAQNRERKTSFKKILDTFKKSPTEKHLSAVFSSLDKLAKTKVIHRNKASRLKSRMAKRATSKKS